MDANFKMVKNKFYFFGLCLFSALSQVEPRKCGISDEGQTICVTDKLPCEIKHSIELSSNFSWLNESIVQTGMSFTKEQYGYHNETDSIRLCTCITKSCLTVYCNEYDETNLDYCLQAMENSTILQDLLEHHNIVITLDRPDCNKREELTDVEAFKFDQGKLRLNIKGISTDFDYDQVYIGVVKENNSNETEEIYFIECMFNCGVNEDDWTKYKNNIMLYISLPALIITFIVYVSFRSLQNLQGKSILCYVYALSVTYFLFPLLHLTDRPDDDTCKMLAYLVYTHIFIAFYCLNTMCFDLYWTFKYLKNFQQESKRFMYYCIYIFGMTLIMLTIVFVFDHNHIEAIKTANLEPLMGQDSCFVGETGYAKDVYLYGPILLIIFMNAIFFILTTVRLIQINRETKVCRSGESKRHLSKDKKRFVLYFRLFIVMGLPWVLEVASHLSTQSRSCFVIWTFILGDILLAFLGLSTFILFTCTNKIKKLFMVKLGLNMSNTVGGTTFSRQSSKFSSVFMRMRSSDSKTSQTNTEISITP